MNDRSMEYKTNWTNRHEREKRTNVGNETTTRRSTEHATLVTYHWDDVILIDNIKSDKPAIVVVSSPCPSSSSSSSSSSPSSSSSSLGSNRVHGCDTRLDCELPFVVSRFRNWCVYPLTRSMSELTYKIWNKDDILLTRSLVFSLMGYRNPMKIIDRVFCW